MERILGSFANPHYNPASNELGAAILGGLLHTKVGWDQPEKLLGSSPEVVYDMDIGSEVPSARQTRVVLYTETHWATVGRTDRRNGKRNLLFMKNVFGINITDPGKSAKLTGNDWITGEPLSVSISLKNGTRRIRPIKSRR